MRIGEELWVEVVNPRELGDWLRKYDTWVMSVTRFLERAFTTEEPKQTFLNKATRRLPMFTSAAEQQRRQVVAAPERLKDAINILVAYGEQLRDIPVGAGAQSQYRPDGSESGRVRKRDTGTEAKRRTRVVEEPPSVFVVHGKDKGLRAQVELLLGKQGIEATVLEDEANRGRTLIEKFEQHTGKIGYAIVIVSPEDRGAGPGQPVPEQPNRARQNVILEYGYLIASLGRDRVALLHRGHVELPSDVGGVAYVSVDEGDWEHRLLRELEAANFVVDYRKR